MAASGFTYVFGCRQLRWLSHRSDKYNCQTQQILLFPSIYATCFGLLLLQALQLHSLNVLAFSTYNFHLLRSWMQLVQFFIFSFFMSFVMSSSHLFFGLPSGHFNIGFHLYTLFTILSSGIRCKWPNQLNRCALM
jgi:hypothetical protein